jgi:uncharacterized membrane protein
MTLIAEEIGLMTAINSLIVSMSNLTASMVTTLEQLQLQIDILKNMFVFIIWGSLALMFIMAVAFYIAFRGSRK